MLRYNVSPGFRDYIERLRAKRERETEEFHKRKAAAIAKQAVDEQGVGE